MDVEEWVIVRENIILKKGFEESVASKKSSISHGDKRNKMNKRKEIKKRHQFSQSVHESVMSYNYILLSYTMSSHVTLYDITLYYIILHCIILYIPSCYIMSDYII